VDSSRTRWGPDLDQHYVAVSVANITNKKCIGSSTEQWRLL